MADTAGSTGFHHVAYACRDGEATRHFYEDLMGMPLVHTEVKAVEGGFFRHLFFDTGDDPASPSSRSRVSVRPLGGAATSRWATGCRSG